MIPVNFAKRLTFRFFFFFIVGDYLKLISFFGGWNTVSDNLYAKIWVSRPHFGVLDVEAREVHTDPIILKKAGLNLSEINSICFFLLSHARIFLSFQLIINNYNNAL